MKIWKGKPIRKLTISYLGSLGRSSNGRITSNHRQAGHRRRLRLIDRFYLITTPSSIVRFEHDPVRNITLALVCSGHGFLSYIPAPKGLGHGDFVYPYTYFPSEFLGSFVTPGSSIVLKSVSVGSVIYDVEASNLSGGLLSRSGGSSSQVIAKLNDKILLKLPSGKFKTLSDSIRCRFGVPLSRKSLQKPEHLNKAGQSRWLGKRPHVRGVAMNPVDHPHGGGEGKTSGGRCSVSPWGFLTKGKRTGSKDSSRLELTKFYKNRK